MAQLDRALRHACGDVAVFRDGRSIRKGQDFLSDIRAALAEACVGGFRRIPEACPQLCRMDEDLPRTDPSFVGSSMTLPVGGGVRGRHGLRLGAAHTIDACLLALRGALLRMSAVGEVLLGHLCDPGSPSLPSHSEGRHVGAAASTSGLHGTPTSADRCDPDTIGIGQDPKADAGPHGGTCARFRRTRFADQCTPGE